MKRRVKASLSTITLLLVAGPLAASAQQLKPNELPTNIPGVTTFALPPQGFNPVTASDQNLAEYGFLPRPDKVKNAKALMSSAAYVTLTLLRL